VHLHLDFNTHAFGHCIIFVGKKVSPTPLQKKEKKKKKKTIPEGACAPMAIQTGEKQVKIAKDKI